MELSPQFILKLDRPDLQFFQRSTQQVAQQLLGMGIVRSLGNKFMIGKIVETESYSFGDPASHCYQKKTVRNCALFGPVGHAYIYTSYGIHYGFNLVAYGPGDRAGGVLIRAVEPLYGISVMQKHRAVSGYSLTNGPGKFTQAFNIDARFYGYNLMQADELFVAYLPEQEDFSIKATPRIGISKAQDYHGRFIIAANPWVTPHRYNK